VLVGRQKKKDENCKILWLLRQVERKLIEKFNFFPVVLREHIHISIYAEYIPSTLAHSL
jgi:hypothetical protein